LSRLFISHSSKDNVAAVAFRQWLTVNGWPKEDIFLDLENIGAGERWKDALRKANARCEAILLLASPDALDSPECLAEVRKAEDFGKEIIVVLLRDVQFEDHRLDGYKDRQIVDVSLPPQSHVEMVQYRGKQYEVRFNDRALASVQEYLFKRGITPDHFAWPPADQPHADPFPGLSAFTEDDAGIFFGRDSDILRGLDKLRLLRRNGTPRLLVIQSASGAGKSSYLRAGLWPRISRDSDFSLVAILRPAQGILSGPEGLGRKLALQLSRPGTPVNAGDIHAQLMAQDAAHAAVDFAKLVATVAAQSVEQRRVSDPNARAPALILAVDQAEELFAAEDAAESERFVFLLARLLMAPPKGVELFTILTIRSDSAARLFQTLADAGLELPDTLPLLPLARTSFRDVILKPLEVIGRRGQRLEITTPLVDQLVADATGADALPLLAFTLSYLYQEFSAGGKITLEQYQAAGGVTRSIDMALKRALSEPLNAPPIPVAKDEQLAQLRTAFIPWLARIDPESGAPMRRVAQLSEFPAGSLGIVQRLIKARLLVLDRRSGADVVEVAHESLLRQWPTLTDWLRADANDLKMIDGVERAASEWVRNGRQSPWLDHRGERLITAERAAKREDFHKRLGEPGIAYLEACRSYETAEHQEKLKARARDRQRKLAQALAATLAVLLVAGLVVLGFQRPLRNALYRWQHLRALAADAERSLAPLQTFTECTDCPEMIVVKGGTFKMGSPDPEHHKGEYPPHEVSVAQFAVSRFELTFAEWDACAAHGDCRGDIGAEWGRDQQPVINVTWQDAKRYVEWLSSITGKPYRLLSEAEWEYAASTGKTSLYFFGNDDAVLDQYSWYGVNAQNQAHAVGTTKKANPFGLSDVYGNVAEWVEDCYHEGYRGAPNDGLPWTTGDCSHRVVRGGYWLSRPAALRSTSRDWAHFDQGADSTGVRVARTLLSR
jgi:formylglycine-generating enzyme required for sulfatase activity